MKIFIKINFKHLLVNRPKFNQKAEKGCVKSNIFCHPMFVKGNNNNKELI